MYILKKNQNQYIPALRLAALFAYEMPFPLKNRPHASPSYILGTSNKVLQLSWLFVRYYTTIFPRSLKRDTDYIQ